MESIQSQYTEENGSINGPASPYNALDGDSFDKKFHASSSLRTPSPQSTRSSVYESFSRREQNHDFSNKLQAESIIDKESIRNEWVDALFGSDFFPRNEEPCSIEYVPALKGEGTAKIPSYVAYRATIEARPSNGNEKIGVTISRLPLGVYAHDVDASSEAYAAGVIPGSVLVDINGMGVLGEPSQKLIERLWQYEGFGSQEGGKGAVDGMLALKFIKNGKLYSAMFLNKPPFGISWAPCANFALVQRSYSFAKTAGIKRGCIIASVNGRSFRNLDHVAAAETLRDCFSKRDKITMTLAYTPAASRSSYFTTLQNHAQSSPKNGKSSRYAFLQKSIACGSTSTAHLKRPAPIQNTQQYDEISKLAELVAAGEVQPASSDIWKRQNRNNSKSNSSVNGRKEELKYLPCPEFERENIFQQWTIFNALFYCLMIGMADYSEENFKLIPQWEDCGNNVDICMEDLEDFNTHEISMFLLQIVGVLGSEELLEEMGERLGTAIVDLVKESYDLCFRFHFLLLSFLGTTVYPSTTSCATLAFVKDKLSTRLAEIESTKSLKQTQSNHTLDVTSPSQVSSFENQKSSDRVQDIVEDIFDEISIENNNKNDFETSPVPIVDEQLENEENAKKKKKKGFMKRFFRKKAKENKVQTLSSSLTPPPSHSPPHKTRDNTLNIEQELSTNASCSPLGSTISQENHFPLHSPVMSNPSQSESILQPILRNKFDHNFSSFDIHHTNSITHSHESGYLTHMSTHIKDFTNFLVQLDSTCEIIKELLIKTKSQKVVEWAMQPWNATKEKTLFEATEKLRSGLRDINENSNFPLINPVEATELLSKVDPDESFIIPSYHFPILLSFDQHNTNNGNTDDVLYRTKVEVVALRGGNIDEKTQGDSVFFIQGSVAGQVQETGKSTLGPYFESTLHRWYNANTMTFDTRSSWGAPKTLSIKMKAVNTNKIGTEQSPGGDEESTLLSSKEVGYCWVDLSDMWNKSTEKIDCHAQLYSSDQVDVEFDAQGDLIVDVDEYPQRLELELRISIDAVPISSTLTSQHPKLCSKKLLLYKHTEDIRQEMLALQFIELCNKLLISSGLDLKIRTFKCCPVGAQSGFVEWVPGSVPLSEICERGGTASSCRASENKNETISFLDGMEMEDSTGRVDSELSSPPESPTCVSPKTPIEKHNYYDIPRFQVLKGLSNFTFGFGVGLGRQGNASIRNPIQDFLRSAAYDPDAPYFINKIIMDAYIKSCAGYCILTYLLGVGDRHLDNLLLHPHGYFLHCDFSYILGQDPKTYIPMRITEEMVMGMGGQESDNFAKFLSFAGATFVALRRHSNLRALMSSIRIMVGANLPDVSLNQSAEDALYALRYRFRLDLSEDDALSFIEKLIEKSITSKLWVAVDAMHSIGKKF